MKKVLIALALAASLTACAIGARPPTEASIAKAADRAVGIETGYAVAAEMTTFGAGAFDAVTQAKMANGDRVAFAALSAGRITYPLALSLAPADAVRLAVAIERSDAAHSALQAALAAPG
ncbi:hypothetical protein HZY97_20125 [Sphingomonas sp. R-74633]|uniref:hypothetical protein n=1 Tax=Sphingomonas sp. R-74633 TaxID=2751188 RepID=UPI0015D3AD1B|nr:hypothetical protein [Sphingomonas sp. R-74633]NYT43093.1 hypothetical protein [Sphingomonas sp. R-74633]